MNPWWNSTGSESKPMNSAELIQAIEDTWRECSKHQGPDFVILTMSMTHARQSRKWRGKSFVFRGIHPELRRILAA